jgi:hypothetical protein
MGHGEHDGGATDVVLIADQLVVELYRALVEPAQVLLGLDATDELEQRLVASVDVLAMRLTSVDATERSSTAHAILSAVSRDSTNREWWDTALGSACRAAARSATNSASGAE